MVFDPHTVRYDIIASLYSLPCTYKELLERFENHTNGFLDMALMRSVNSLEREGKILQTKKGIYKAPP